MLASTSLSFDTKVVIIRMITNSSDFDHLAQFNFSNPDSTMLKGLDFGNFELAPETIDNI